MSTKSYSYLYNSRLAENTVYINFSELFHHHINIKLFFSLTSFTSLSRYQSVFYEISKEVKQWESGRRSGRVVVTKVDSKNTMMRYIQRKEKYILIINFFSSLDIVTCLVNTVNFRLVYTSVVLLLLCFLLLLDLVIVHKDQGYVVRDIFLFCCWFCVNTFSCFVLGIICSESIIIFI